MEEEKEEFKLSLGLAIGIDHEDRRHKKHQKPHVQLHALFPPRPTEEEEGEEEEQQRSQQSKRSRNGEEEDLKGDGARKKLRLTQEQSILLEDTFRENNTLTSLQKQELAEKLNLKPRQVEVWFQNRRARNKMKQTEVDFQKLKKWCETMHKENMKLKNELQELKLMKKPDGTTLCLDLPRVTTAETKLTLCPSCSRVTTMDSSKKSSTSEDSSIDC